MESKIFARVVKVLGNVTGKQIDSFNLQGDLRNELCLDSIQIVEFFASLEEEFRIELPLELMAVKTGSEFITLLEECLMQAFQQKERA